VKEEPPAESGPVAAVTVPPVASVNEKFLHEEMAPAIPFSVTDVLVNAATPKFGVGESGASSISALAMVGLLGYPRSLYFEFMGSQDD
jgi:hypothetical protein